jgi:hypothetical protein
MAIHHAEIGVCGLSCRLCPHHHTDAESRCGGCKSESRMAVGCPFITCAVKRKGIEFCWECDESDSCERWAGHREFGRTRDTFVCYASLEDNITRIARDGLDAFIEDQCEREQLLVEMIAEFNEGRSKTYYSIAATTLDPAEVRAAIESARASASGMDARGRSKVLHASLDAIANARSLSLALRK